MSKKEAIPAQPPRACRTDDAFVDYVLGDLTESARGELERHSRTCPECRLRLGAFRSAGATLDRMFMRAPRRVEIAPAERLLRAILARLPEQRLFYDVLDVPAFAQILLAATERGLCFLSFREAAQREYLDQWVEADFTVIRSEEALRGAADQLRRYFAGRLRTFELPLDLRFATAFTRTVLGAAARVGFGQVSTYRDIAAAIRRPKAARAVGNALGRNPLPIVIPCHRVVASDGLGGYTGGLAYKRKLLRIEGIEIGGGDLFA